MTFSDLSGAARMVMSMSPPSADQSSMAFELQAGELTAGELKVRNVRGREAISDCYCFDIEVASNIDPLTIKDAVLGQTATLWLRSPAGASRSVNGIIVSMRESGPLRHHDRRFSFRLVPHLWLLRRRRNSRIFQDLSVVDVIPVILKEAGIAHRWNLERKYPTRTYCVQYRETDYEFVTRLLREDGIFFYFEQAGQSANPIAGAVDAIAGAVDALVDSATGAANGDASDDGETVVFTDVARGYPAIDPAGAAVPTDIGAAIGMSLVGAVTGVTGSSPSLAFRAADGVSSHDDSTIPAFDLERRLRSKAVTVHDYDFKHPLLDLTASVKTPMPGAEGADEDTAALMDPATLEIYEHHGEYEETNVRQRSAQTLLEGYRVDAFHGEGVSACRRLAPGYKFTLDEHPDSRFNREYVVTEITHVGHVPENSQEDPTGAARRLVYENRFKCLTSSTPARPRPRSPRLQQVVEVATVVGPAGEEIYTDQYGRIKVQFPWDREGKRDEKSSCWIRVSQAWAGATWGAQFIPRIGMEVLVTFIGGDVDRPMVTGCVYNAIHPTPFELPDDKTRSGWRTQSTPGSSGFNELSFEDKAGAEQIFIHAQRDLDEVIENNHTSKVLNDETNLVTRNQADTVVGDRVRTTQGNETVAVIKNQTIKIEGNRADEVDGSEDVKVGKDLTSKIGGRERREVAAVSDAAYSDEKTVRVRGSYTTVVGRKEATRSYVLHVEGTTAISGSKTVEISSETAVVLRCGKSTLRITPAGIEINAPGVQMIGKGASVSADDKLRIATKGDATFLADTILLKTSQASVALSKEAKIDGTQILLNSPANAKDPAPPKPPPPTLVELVDLKGKPIPNQRYEITLDDGSILSGVTDKDGKAEVSLEGSGTVLFPDLSDLKQG